MPILLITYELASPNTDYLPLYNRISRFPAVQIAQSTWAIQTNQGPDSVAASFKEVLNPGDKLFVNNFSDWSAHSLPDTTANWIRQHR